MSVLRRICGITRRDQRRNSDIKEELEIKLDIMQHLQRLRLAYFGHVACMSNDRYQNITATWIWKWSANKGQTEEEVS